MGREKRDKQTDESGLRERWKGREIAKGEISHSEESFKEVGNGKSTIVIFITQVERCRASVCLQNGSKVQFQNFYNLVREILFFL